jgi:endonuclease-3
MNAVATQSGTRAAMQETLRRLRNAYGAPLRGERAAPLDELIQTILSQHTSDGNTARAFASLRARFPDWQQVVDAPVQDIADAIRSGGLADVKAPRIQQVLREVRKRCGSYDIGVLAALPPDDARRWLTSLHGVGPKTAACVLLFALDRDVMPVDTHVHRVALRLGLIPPGTSAERAQELLERQTAPGRMYDAHMLLIRHGRATCVARRPRCECCVLNDICPSSLVRTDDISGPL